jgi:hypothetical protein
MAETDARPRGVHGNHENEQKLRADIPTKSD